MTKRNSALLGLLTVLLPCLYCLFIAFFFSFNPDYQGSFSLMNLNIVFIFSVLALEVVYCVDVIRSKRLSKYKRALWILLIFFMNLLIMPFYWYFHIWRTGANTAEIAS